MEKYFQVAAMLVAGIFFLLEEEDNDMVVEPAVLTQNSTLP